MKILEINKFNFVRDGADKHFLELMNLLKANGHEVAVFSMKHPKNKFSPWKKYFVSYVGSGKRAGFGSKIKAISRIYSLEAKRKMARLLDDFQPEIVHIHDIRNLSPSILGEIKKRNIPVIMTIHDYSLISPDYDSNSGRESWKEVSFKKCRVFIGKKRVQNSYWLSALAVGEFAFNKFFRLYGCVDLFIAPSMFCREKLIRGGISKEKIAIIPHFFQGHCEPQKTCDWKRGKYVIYFGEISRQRGADRLIKLFAERKNIKLYLAGRLKEGFVIPKNKNIKSVGSLNSSDLNDYIKNSLFAISYSRHPETFGSMALDAMKNGKPFVGYSGNAADEIIESDRSGYLAKDQEELEKYIDKLIADDGLRILFSRNALERAEGFNSYDYYEKIMSVFVSAIKADKRRSTQRELIARMES